MFVGMTTVFVPQDLEFVGARVSDLEGLSPRLVPLIAHDRSGFGGASFQEASQSCSSRSTPSAQTTALCGSPSLRLVASASAVPSACTSSSPTPLSATYSPPMPVPRSSCLQSQLSPPAWRSGETDKTPEPAASQLGAILSKAKGTASLVPWRRSRRMRDYKQWQARRLSDRGLEQRAGTPRDLLRSFPHPPQGVPLRAGAPLPTRATLAFPAPARKRPERRRPEGAAVS